MKKTYLEKLKDPRWQKKRLEILERDCWKCTECNNDKLTLHVHHSEYNGEPWEIPNDKLKTLCENCHSKKSNKILQIENLLKTLDLIYSILPIYGDSDSCHESYTINVSGFGRKWKDVL